MTHPFTCWRIRSRLVNNIFFSFIFSLPLVTGSAVGGSGTLSGLPQAPESVFELAFFDFRWGLGDQGSEHTVDGTQYAIELQLYHFDTQYGNLSNAVNVWADILYLLQTKYIFMQYPGGVVAISVFFQPSIAHNVNLLPITNALSSVNFGGSALLSGLDLQALVYPALTGDIFVYEFETFLA